MRDTSLNREVVGIATEFLFNAELSSWPPREDRRRIEDAKKKLLSAEEIEILKDVTGKLSLLSIGSTNRSTDRHDSGKTNTINLVRSFRALDLKSNSNTLPGLGTLDRDDIVKAAGYSADVIKSVFAMATVSALMPRDLMAGLREYPNWQTRRRLADKGAPTLAATIE